MRLWQLQIAVCFAVLLVALGVQNLGHFLYRLAPPSCAQDDPVERKLCSGE
jgi:hypothetical protein